MTARAAAALAALALVASGCHREQRDFAGNAGYGGVAEVVRVTELRPGAAGPDVDASVYQENRWAVSEGYQLYQWMNCAGCHAAGGGGAIGPPFRRGPWIYGSSPQNVYASIVQGRPNGMPAFGGRLEATEVWKLVAYVRSMDRLTPPDTWMARADAASYSNPWRRNDR